MHFLGKCMLVKKTVNNFRTRPLTEIAVLLYTLEWSWAMMAAIIIDYTVTHLPRPCQKHVLCTT